MKYGVFALLALISYSPAAFAAGKKPGASSWESVRSPRVERLFGSMRAGVYKDAAFPALTLADVPALLEVAKSRALLRTFPRDSVSSQFEATCSEGMVALWLIEGIRMGGKFPSLNSLCLHEKETSTDWTKASECNRRRLTWLYQFWWDKVKGDRNCTGIDCRHVIIRQRRPPLPRLGIR
jgi:hypothetical protein